VTDADWFNSHHVTVLAASELRIVSSHKSSKCYSTSFSWTVSFDASCNWLSGDFIFLWIKSIWLCM